MIDYYELLQISPHADSDTIHRVYRFLASRFHPDNQRTGNAEMFRLLKTAYDILTDPACRAEYDVRRNGKGADKTPLSTSIDFMDRVLGAIPQLL